MAPLEKVNGRVREELIAGLDIGTSSVACLIAQANSEGRPEVVGIGHQPSKGMRAGCVVDLEQAREAVLATVHAAERMAGRTVHRVSASVGCGKPASQRLSFSSEPRGREIGAADVRKLVEQSRNHVAVPDRETLHTLPLGFRVDGQRGIRDPNGLFGDVLALEINAVTAEKGPLRTLLTCVSGSHLEIGSLVAAPYAAALACLVEDELQLGTILIDMGGGTTSVAVFEEGVLAFVDTLPIGGAHVTQDIAHGLSTPVPHAERMKVLFGSALARPGDDREIIDVPQIGVEPQQSNHMPKSLLTGIIKPRIEETIELIRGKLEASGIGRSAARRVVITGGASQLAGVGELAGSILDRPVRIGRPRRLPGIAEAATGPAFAAVTGLVFYAVEPKAAELPLPHTATPKQRQRARQLAGDADPGAPPPASRPGMIGRIGSWLHDHF
jgi:cell division protein FtsA